MDLEELSRYGIENAEGTYYYKNIEDTRKPKLTLKHLNKMKKIKAVKRLELLRRQELLQVMYGQPEGGDDGGGGMGF